MKKNNTFLYYVLYPIHALAWLGLAAMIVIGLEWHYLLYTLIGWVLIEGVGVAVVLHRYVSHRSFEARAGVKPILLWLACLSLQGSPLGWAAIHRGSHHRYSDTDRDAHTPTKGKFYAWHMWLHDWDQYFNPKYAIDLVRDPMHMWIATHYVKIIFVTYLAVFLISPTLLLFGFIIPAAISLYQESNINVFCHSPGYGYRNFETKDQSRNIPSLAWITWGQGWHNNHHEKSSSYDFGTSVSGNPKEFDPSLLLLPLVATRASRQQIYQARRLRLNAK